jgi:hypothetical protein
VIDIQQKRKRRETENENVDYQVRNHDNGWVYCREDVNLPDVAIQLAKDALLSLGLTFGAVDLIYNAKRDAYYALEVNTAPGLEGTTLENYTSYFQGVLNAFNGVDADVQIRIPDMVRTERVDAIPTGRSAFADMAAQLTDRPPPALHPADRPPPRPSQPVQTQSPYVWPVDELVNVNEALIRGQNASQAAEMIRSARIHNHALAISRRQLRGLQGREDVASRREQRAESGRMTRVNTVWQNLSNNSGDSDDE